MPTTRALPSKVPPGENKSYVVLRDTSTVVEVDVDVKFTVAVSILSSWSKAHSDLAMFLVTMLRSGKAFMLFKTE